MLEVITNLYDFKDSQTKLQHLRHFTYIQKEIQLNRYDPESLHLNKFIFSQFKIMWLQMLNFTFFQFSFDYVRSQSRFHSSNLFIFDYNCEKDETDFQIIPFRKTNLQTGMISRVEIDIGCSFH